MVVIEDIVEEFLDKNFELKSADEILNSILSHWKEVQNISDSERKLKKADDIAKKICKDVANFKHPVLAKVVNIGYVKGTSKGKLMFKLKETIKEALLNKNLEQFEAKREILNTLRQKLREYRDDVKNYLIEKTTKG